MRLMNKARTAISYTLMGMRLGCSVIDKINLGTMLFRYKTKLLLNWPRKIHCVNIKGLVFPLFIREEDIDILYSIFYRKDYLFQEMAVARPSVIIDLGAHIGLASIFFNTLFPNARIYCFEPDPLNFQLLEKTHLSLIIWRFIRLQLEAPQAKPFFIVILSGMLSAR